MSLKISCRPVDVLIENLFAHAAEEMKLIGTRREKRSDLRGFVERFIRNHGSGKSIDKPMFIESHRLHPFLKARYRRSTFSGFDDSRFDIIMIS